MEKFLRGVRARAGRGEGKLVQRLLANKYYALAVDQSMCTAVGLSLNDFKPAVRVRSLEAGEERFYVDTNTLPLQLQAASQGRAKRACIRTRSTGATRFEVLWATPRRVLITHIDSGSIGFPAQFRIYTDWAIRGWFDADVTHKRHNIFLSAVHAAGLDFVKHEMVLATSVGNAPYHGCGHFGKLSDVAEEYFANHDFREPLYQKLYLIIVHYWYGGAPPVDVGTEQHQRMFWTMMENCPVLRGKLETAKLGRWFAFRRRWDEFEKYTGVMLLVITYMGIILSWWQTIDDSPVHVRKERELQRPADQHPLAEDAPDGGNEPGQPPRGGAAQARGHADPMRSVAASNNTLDKLSGNKNALYVVGNTMGNAITVALATGLAAVAKPVDDEHGRTLVSAKTRRGALEWHIDMATSGTNYLDAVLEVFQDRHVLQRMGVISSADATRPALHLGNDEKHIMRALWSLAVRLVGGDWLLCLGYSHSFPWSFAGMLSSRADTRAATARFCERVWGAVCLAEAASLEDAWLAGWLNNLHWTRGCWIRELFLAMSETSFHSLPPDMKRELTDALSSLGTKDIEDSFNMLRRVSRKHPSQQMSPVAQWHCLTNSTLLEEAGIGMVQTVADDVLRTRETFPASAFKARSRDTEFSLGQDPEKRE